MEDVSRLLDALQALVNAGNTVLVIEHNTDVMKVADHIVDLGPEGGEGGGQLVGIEPQSTLLLCRHRRGVCCIRRCKPPQSILIHCAPDTSRVCRSIRVKRIIFAMLVYDSS